MRRCCEECGRFYDDVDRWTICPHRSLGEAPRPPQPTKQDSDQQSMASCLLLVIATIASIALLLIIIARLP